VVAGVAGHLLAEEVALEEEGEAISPDTMVANEEVGGTTSNNNRTNNSTSNNKFQRRIV